MRQAAQPPSRRCYLSTWPLALALAAVALCCRCAFAVDTEATSEASAHSTAETSPPPLTDISHLLHDSQFRSDCRTRRFLLIDPALFNLHTLPRSYPGLARGLKEDSLDLATLHMRLAGALAEAVHSNRTLIFSESSRVIRTPRNQPATEAGSSAPSDLTPQQVVKILMRKCNLYHTAPGRPFYSAHEPGVARLRYHHSCWFQPISNCFAEHITDDDWQALEARPNGHTNRLKYSELMVAQAAMWVPPVVLRDEEDESQLQVHLGAVERWSASLVSFIGRPVALMEKHLTNYVRRVSSDFIQLAPDSNHPHLAGVSIRMPPWSTGDKPRSAAQQWQQYLRILEQLQNEVPVGERHIATQQIWISTWEQEQYDLIDAWHEKMKANNALLADVHIVLSQLRHSQGQHHDDGIELPELLAGESATYDARPLMDRLNLQALHSLEEATVIGRATYFISSVSHPHSVWLQCVRNSHTLPTPPIWLGSPLSAEGFFPSLSGFGQDEGFGKTPAGKPLTNAQKWARVATMGMMPSPADIAAPLPPSRLSTNNALPDVPFAAIDRLLPHWNSPLTPFEAPPRHDEL